MTKMISRRIAVWLLTVSMVFSMISVMPAGALTSYEYHDGGECESTGEFAGEPEVGPEAKPEDEIIISRERLSGDDYATPARAFRGPHGVRLSDTDRTRDPEEIVEVAVQFVTPPAVALRLLDEDSGVRVRTEQAYDRQALAAHTAFRSQLEGLIGEAPPGVMTPSVVPFEIFSEHHSLFNGVFMRVPQYMVRQIEQLPEVYAVTPNQRFYTTAAPTPINENFMRESRELFNINHIHNNIGLTGAGVRVAVLDTGIDHNHQEFIRFRDPNTGRIRGQDFTNSPHGLMDINGHGTHVSGTVIAMAPNVELWHYKVLGDGGEGSGDWVISALERAHSDGMDVVNLSLGTLIPGPFTPMDQAVNLLVMDGITAVVSAGNSGLGGLFTVTSPALAGLAITVANGTAGGQDWWLGDTVAPGSSRGPVMDTWHIKPDITAPGTAIFSALPGNNYAAWSGTSMAAPHIAGIAALLIQQNPNVTPIEVKARMMNTARPLANYSDSVFSIGAGFVDPIAALSSQAFATARHEIPWGDSGNNRLETMASLSFGAIDRDVTAGRNITIPVTIHNRSNAAQTYTISPVFSSTQTPRPNLAVQSSVTVLPNSSATFNATMQVSGNTAAGLHYGFVNINLGGTKVARLPFAVMVSGTITVTVSNEQQLRDAIDASVGMTIVVNIDRNINLTGPLYIPPFTNVTLRGVGASMPALTATFNYYKEHNGWIGGSPWYGVKDWYTVFIGEHATLTINNIEITRRPATEGGGVFIYDWGTLIMQSGAIRGHNVSGIQATPGVFQEFGGAVTNQQGMFIMKGGVISGNHAFYGAGVYIDGWGGASTFIMEGGSIQNNHAVFSGGGVHIDGVLTSFSMTGGVITDNTAPRGSGVYSEGQWGWGSVSNGVVFGVGSSVSGVANRLSVHSSGIIIAWNGHGSAFNHGARTGLASNPGGAAFWDIRGGIANGRNNIVIPVAGVTVRSAQEPPSERPPPEWQIPTPAAALPFTDSRGHWGVGPIGWAHANDITRGTSATTFNPNGNVTRGQFVTFLYRIAGRPPVTIAPRFSDVPTNHMFIAAITWAANVGVTSGVGDGTRFAPGDYITREQMVTMLRSYIRHIGGNVNAPHGALDRFGAADRNAVSSWALDSVRWAAANGVIGANNILNPRGNATRAETVTMLQRTVNTFNIPAP